MAAPKNTGIKEQILQSTTLLLQKTSFADISLADIAQAAQISKGTLYYYYKNKDDILFDIADIYFTRLAEDLIAWADNKSKDTSLHRMLNYIFSRGIYNESGNLRLYLLGAAVSGHEAVRLKLIEKYNYFKNEIKQRLMQRADINGEYAAWLILTVMDGILIQAQLQNEEFNQDAFIENTIFVLESGMKQ